jgi:hypothetical protein
VSKRPPIDLAAITSQVAEPMQEAAQRAPIPAAPAPRPKAPARPPEPETRGGDEFRTENLVPMAFKVTKQFQKRFKTAALEADLKMVELLYEALDVWEKKAGRARGEGARPKSRILEDENY